MKKKAKKERDVSKEVMGTSKNGHYEPEMYRNVKVKKSGRKYKVVVSNLSADDQASLLEHLDECYREKAECLESCLDDDKDDSYSIH